MEKVERGERFFRMLYSVNKGNGTSLYPLCRRKHLSLKAYVPHRE